MKKRIISILLSFAIILCAVTATIQFAATEKQGYILGDVDGDGDATVLDATYVQRYATMVKIPISKETLMNGDVDGDGDLTIVDATFIQRFSTRVKTPYSIGKFIETSQPATDPSLVVDKITSAPGKTVSVAVSVLNNPGILGMTLTLSYDSKVLTLKDSVNGSAVSEVLTLTKPGKYTNPCNFAWDGIEISDEQIKDGEILILTFAVSQNAGDGVYPITLSYDSDSIFDKDLVPVDLDIINGSITVGNTVTDPTQQTEPTQPGTDAPVTTPSFVVEKATASAGDTVTLAIDVENNPGILGMTLTLSYNSKVLTLKNSVNGSAVSDALTLTKPGKYTSPCNFAWDGIELSDDQIKDGEILVLTFNVASNAAKGTYPITISYDNDSIFNADLMPVDLDIINGSVTVK